MEIPHVFAKVRAKEETDMDVRAYLKDYLAGYKHYKPYWNYEDGCVLLGCIDLYEATGDPLYRDFVLAYLREAVTPAGEIPNYEFSQYNIDSINSGKALFFAWKETGDDRYRKAIELHMQRLREHPRCACGNFWHKSLYPQQIWLDGLYMAQPFYMAYEKECDGWAQVEDIVNQFRNVRKYLFCPEKGLYYHACDTIKAQPWANKETGCSPNFWLRSMGWYLMALVDCLDIMGSETAGYEELRGLFREAVAGIRRYAEPVTGMFYQVIDHGENPENYLETSGTAMVAYACMKGARLGLLEGDAKAAGRKAFESLLDKKLVQGTDGKTHLTDICWVAGLGPGEKRDGSVAYYLSEPRVNDDSKGVGPFMMAYAEYLRG